MKLSKKKQVQIEDDEISLDQYDETKEIEEVIIKEIKKEKEEKAKKPLLVRRNPRMETLFELYYEGGGERPKELCGNYTSKIEAENAAEAYLNKRDK